MAYSFKQIGTPGQHYWLIADGIKAAVVYRDPDAPDARQWAVAVNYGSPDSPFLDLWDAPAKLLNASLEWHRDLHAITTALDITGADQCAC